MSRLPATLLVLAAAALACAQSGPRPTAPPPPVSATITRTPGPETPTPRPEMLTQPAAGETGPPVTQTPAPPLSGEAFARLVPIGEDVPGTVRDLRFTPDGTLWLLTDQVVARLAGEAWSVYVPAFDGDLLGIDDFQRVWVAARDGASVQAWNGADWQTYGSADGWLARPAGATIDYGVTSDQAGQVWVATTQDVRAFDGERWTVYDRAALGLGEVTDASEGASTHFTLHVASDGSLWASACEVGPPGATAAGGVRWYDGTAWLGAGSPVEQGCGGAVASSLDGTVWVGLNAEVFAFDSATGDWTAYQAPAPPEGQRFGSVAGLALDPAGRPWPLLTLCGGASCGTGWVRYRLGDDGTWNRVDETRDGPQSLYFDITGAAWLLSTAGVERAAGEQIQAAGEMQALASAIDATGQIFVVGEQAGGLALWLIRPVSD